MNKRSSILLVAGLILIAGAAGLLAHLRASQRLGPPAVKTSAIPGSIRLNVELPEQILNYTSRVMEVDKLVLDYLPKDTSFGQRFYSGADESQTAVNVVLMGTDRSSLHKPEFCLEGQGWRIDHTASTETTVRMDKPEPYDLPVMKLVATKEGTRGIYVYWFVAPGEYTARHNQRMVWMARDMLRTGVLQRWAYITYFTICLPGQEDAAFERVKKMIAASVPEFQLTPPPAGTSVTARQ
jgi:hypothetical protein